MTAVRLRRPMDPSIVRRVRFGAAVLCVLAGVVNPLLAQRHTTAPPVKSWASVGSISDSSHTIWVENGDSLPVVITKMRLSNCVNVQIPCRDSTPAVKILAPKEHSKVAVILAKDPKEDFSYRFGLDWRVATECKGVAPRLPEDEISGALTPAKPIAIQFPSGAYADKWPGGTYGVFYVAADGTTDSVKLAFSPGPYRDIMQEEIFSEYVFSPARFHGCPVASSTELRMHVDKGLPKPSAYEGFPPTPDEVARDTRGSRHPNSPAEPYTTRPACPFECCQYGEWRARTESPVYATQGRVDEILFTLRPGDSVRATTGNVRIARVGRVKIVGKMERGWAEFGEHKLPVPAIGDTVYILSYAGEGGWEYWYRGLVGTGGELWTDRTAAGIVPGLLVSEPVSEWWVRVTDRRGRSGWIIVPPEGFDGYDGCG